MSQVNASAEARQFADPHSLDHSGRGSAAVAEVLVGPGLPARIGAEVFGTFFLVLAILGTAVYSFLNAGAANLGVALAAGIALLGGIAAVGHVSGGHFNPAVTLGAAIAGRTSWANVAPYWIAQFVGALLAGLVVFATIPAKLPEVLQAADKSGVFASTVNGYGAHSPLAVAAQGQVEFGLWAALLIETIITAVFVGVILGVTDERRRSRFAPVAIGLTLTVGILVAQPITNGSLNPARSLAAAVFAGSGDIWAQQWVFLVAPVVGAAIAALSYRAFAFAPVEDDLLGEDVAVVAETGYDVGVDVAGQAPDVTTTVPAAGAVAAAPAEAGAKSADPAEAGARPAEGTEATTAGGAGADRTSGGGAKVTAMLSDETPTPAAPTPAAPTPAAPTPAATTPAAEAEGEAKAEGEATKAEGEAEAEGEATKAGDKKSEGTAK